MYLQTIDATRLTSQRPDIFITALGFESRARAVAQKMSLPAVSIAFGFDHNKALAYEENLVWFKSKDFLVIENVAGPDFGKTLEQNLNNSIEQFSEAESITIAVDVSCFDRLRLAEIVLYLRAVKREVSIEFWYAIAEFEPPSSTLTRNEFAGPVHRNFSGRFLEPGRPLAVIAGLGYELGRVMGAVEYLQASRVLALIPDSPIGQFEREVLKANETMLLELEARQIIHYPVDDPERTISILDTAIRGFQNGYNIVLLPSGPKIFVLCSLIAQSLHKNIAIWRVSSGGSIKPRDVRSSDKVVGLLWRPKSEFLTA